jgi:hypothetical protein
MRRFAWWTVSTLIVSGLLVVAPARAAMSPSFTSKNGVRYRSYVSTALNGTKTQGRIGHAHLTS